MLAPFAFYDRRATLGEIGISSACLTDDAANETIRPGPSRQRQVRFQPTALLQTRRKHRLMGGAADTAGGASVATPLDDASVGMIPIAH